MFLLLFAVFFNNLSHTIVIILTLFIHILMTDYSCFYLLFFYLCFIRLLCCDICKISAFQVMSLCVSEFHADVQQLLVIKEEVPPEWSPSDDQWSQEPLCIKEEREELCTTQTAEHFKGLEDADTSRLPFTAAPVKSEDGEEKPNSSELYCHQTSKQIKTETDGDDCGGPESARNLDTKSTLQPNEVENDSDSSETELSNDGDEWQGPLSDFRPGTEDSDKDWEASRSPESGVNCHVRCDTTKKPFSCSECGKCFLHRQSLHRHMRIHTREKPFCCAVCGEKFSRKTHFKTHMRVHTGEKPFDCGFCGKRFSQKSNFKEHLRVHTGETPFGCDACGKRFRVNFTLKRHMRVHTGEKPFVCVDCGKTFSSNTHLKTHTRVHTGEKPFSCGVCGERFAQQGVLKSHTRVHTGEKPFGCGLCGKRFRQQNTLKRHMSVHTGEKPFSCGICGERYTRQGSLKRHMSVHTTAASTTESHACHFVPEHLEPFGL